MKYIIAPRNGGKTTTLLRRREETGGVIVVSSVAEKQHCQSVAKRNGWSTEGIFSLADFNSPLAKNRGWSPDGPIYIDNADMLFRTLLYDVVQHPSAYNEDRLICSITSDNITTL